MLIPPTPILLSSLIYTYLGAYFNQPGVANITVVQFVKGLSSGKTGLIYKRKSMDTNEIRKQGNKRKKKKSNQRKKARLCFRFDD